MRFPVSLLNSIDLPTFGRPTIATIGFAIDITSLLHRSSRSVGVDAHIDPAVQIVFTEIFGEFVRALGAMWASPPTQYMEDSRSDVGIFSTYTELIFTQATE